MGRYSGGYIRFTLSGGSTVTIPGSINLRANAVTAGDDQGELFDRTLSMVGFSPVASIVSKHISAVLDLIGIAGQCVGSGHAITTVDIIWRRAGDCDDSLGSSPHIQDRVVKGLLVLNSVDAPRKADASISFTLYTLSVSPNSPITRTNGVATPLTIISAQFEMGVPAFAATPFPDCQGWALNFGVNVDTDSAVGTIYPEVAAVLTVRPTLSFSNRDLSLVTNALLAAGYATGTHANTLLQLMRKAVAGGYEDFGTAVHTRFTLAGLITPDEIAGAAPNQRSTNSQQLTAYYDGTNAPVVVDTTAIYDNTP